MITKARQYPQFYTHNIEYRSHISYISRRDQNALCHDIQPANFETFISCCRVCLIYRSPLVSLDYFTNSSYLDNIKQGYASFLDVKIWSESQLVKHLLITFVFTQVGLYIIKLTIAVNMLFATSSMLKCLQTPTVILVKRAFNLTLNVTITNVPHQDNMP